MEAADVSGVAASLYIQKAIVRVLRKNWAAKIGISMSGRCFSMCKKINPSFFIYIYQT